MAIAGRSYPNVPVISRGALEDPTDFASRTRVTVVSVQPSRAQLTVPPVTVGRNTLADPPVLTTAAPVVVAAPTDRRWFAGGSVQVLAAPKAPLAVAAATPGPVVLAAQPDRRWFSTRPPLVLPGLSSSAPPAGRGLLMASIV